ncbi:hypothetical protein [Pararhodobacter sp. CCB-MM2]|uniref:hypothetical protein n=1 Tax=Pararhodobacter sp. CCB-MM2 TaxID=1786003 RepID=UPI000B25E558|nr:hypothetical protein [Pararhodobacter sp. CCB-MM2]
MATVTHVCTMNYVAKMRCEDPELLEAIVSNDDNLTYGDIISVYTSSEEAITALTECGIRIPRHAQGRAHASRNLA